MKEILFVALFLLACSSNREAEYPDYDSEDTSEDAEEAAEEQEEEASYPEQIEDDQVGCGWTGDCEETSSDETSPSQPEPEYPDEDSD